MAQGRVDQITIPIALNDHDQRIQRLERNPVIQNAGSAPAQIAWANGLCENFVLPKTIGGAGFDGTDFVVINIGEPDGDDGSHSILFSNAGNQSDPDHGFMPTISSGDLHQAGFLIYSNHYPLTDWDYVSDDGVSSIRIAEGYGGTYRMFLKALVSGDAVADQIIGFAVQANGMTEGGNGGWASAGGNDTWSVWPSGGPPAIQAVDGTETTAFTDPGSSQFAVDGGYVRADWQALLGTRGDTFSDLVFFGWNPGPDDVIVNLGIELLKLDTSGDMFID